MGRIDSRLDVDHTYVCKGCSTVFGDYDAAVEHADRCDLATESYWDTTEEEGA